MNEISVEPVVPHLLSVEGGHLLAGNVARIGVDETRGIGNIRQPRNVCSDGSAGSGHVIPAARPVAEIVDNGVSGPLAGNHRGNARRIRSDLFGGDAAAGFVRGAPSRRDRKTRRAAVVQFRARSRRGDGRLIRGGESKSRLAPRNWRPADGRWSTCRRRTTAWPVSGGGRHADVDLLVLPQPIDRLIPVPVPRAMHQQLKAVQIVACFDPISSSSSTCRSGISSEIVTHLACEIPCGAEQLVAMLNHLAAPTRRSPRTR